MIHIITQDNRHLFHDLIVEMHRQRKRLFIDELGWTLDAREGLEIDAFDGDDAFYLALCTRGDGALAASVRLLPTMRAHLMSEVFPHLCQEGVPRSERIWEASRFCPAPTTAKGGPRRALLGAMIAGIIETGLIYGIEEVSFVAGAALAPLAAKAGWTARALGPSTRYGRERVCAMAARLDTEGLWRVRARHALSHPLVRLVDGAALRAA